MSVPVHVNERMFAVPGLEIAAVGVEMPTAFFFRKESEGIEATGRFLGGYRGFLHGGPHTAAACRPLVGWIRRRRRSP